MIAVSLPLTILTEQFTIPLADVIGSNEFHPPIQKAAVIGTNKIIIPLQLFIQNTCGDVIDNITCGYVGGNNFGSTITFLQVGLSGFMLPIDVNFSTYQYNMALSGGTNYFAIATSATAGATAGVQCSLVYYIITNNTP